MNYYDLKLININYFYLNLVTSILKKIVNKLDCFIPIKIIAIGKVQNVI